MIRTKPTFQQYSSYTPDDFKVWRMLFERQTKLLEQNACAHYLNAIKWIGFNANEIPDFVKINERLLYYTGWQIKVVPETVPQREFFALLARKIFPATCWLRTMSELDYLNEPDMFHDIFGHVPLLVNPEYAEFLEGFGRLSLKWSLNEEAIKLLSCIYWYTIEFGLLRENGREKIYGAGILSSAEETRNCLSNTSAKLEFEIEKITSANYVTDRLQSEYFVISSFIQLCSALPKIDLHIEKYFLEEIESIEI